MSKPLRILFTFLVGSLFFIILPIAGWGVMDLNGFFTGGARLVFVALVCVLNAFAAIRIPEIGKKREEEKTSVKRQHFAVTMFQVLSISLVIVAPFSDRREIAVIGGGESIRFAGLLLYCGGFLLMHFAEWYLGKHFSVEVAVQHHHSLVTNGPYRYLLHPRYLGMILFTSGIALVFRSWIGLGLAGVTLVVLFWRIFDEESFMRQEFGAEWEEYAKKRWRLIPFVY